MTERTMNPPVPAAPGKALPRCRRAPQAVCPTRCPGQGLPAPSPAAPRKNGEAMPVSHLSGPPLAAEKRKIIRENMTKKPHVK